MTTQNHDNVTHQKQINKRLNSSGVGREKVHQIMDKLKKEKQIPLNQTNGINYSEISRMYDVNRETLRKYCSEWIEKNKEWRAYTS